jgi:hypothetical protein
MFIFAYDKKVVKIDLKVKIYKLLDRFLGLLSKILFLVASLIDCAINDLKIFFEGFQNGFCFKYSRELFIFSIEANS